MISVSVATGTVSVLTFTDATFPLDTGTCFVVPSRVTSYVFPSVNPANVVNVTFVASLLSTDTDLTGTITLFSVFLTVISEALISFVAPVIDVSKVSALVCATDLRTYFFTSTSLVVSAESLPTVILAVIVALPALTPVTVPSAATVAIESSLDV